VLYQLSYSRLNDEDVVYGLGRLRQPLFGIFVLFQMLTTSISRSDRN